MVALTARSNDCIFSLIARSNGCIVALYSPINKALPLPLLQIPIAVSTKLPIQALVFSSNCRPIPQIPTTHLFIKSLQLPYITVYRIKSLLPPTSGSSPNIMLQNVPLYLPSINYCHFTSLVHSPNSQGAVTPFAKFSLFTNSIAMLLVFQLKNFLCQVSIKLKNQPHCNHVSKSLRNHIITEKKTILFTSAVKQTEL